MVYYISLSLSLYTYIYIYTYNVYTYNVYYFIKLSLSSLCVYHYLNVFRELHGLLPLAAPRAGADRGVVPI